MYNSLFHFAVKYRDWLKDAKRCSILRSIHRHSKQEAEDRKMNMRVARRLVTRNGDILPMVNRILSVNVALLELLKNLFINRTFDFSMDEREINRNHFR